MTRIVECKYCGKEFEAKNNRTKFCSNVCANKHHNYFKDKRLKSCSVVDKNVSLGAVYKRFNGICVLCGCKTKLNDYMHAKGTIITGNTYPSVDHITPISKGGNHTWDNVQLVCRMCNCVKYNKVRYEGWKTNA